VVTNPYLMVIDHWQTLIAGIFVLVAAVAAIWVAPISTGREIKAANGQTEVARKQIDASWRQERRRFMSLMPVSMMRAAMIMTVKTSVMRERHSLGVAGSAMNSPTRNGRDEGLIGTNSNVS
jgi:hypothetical protein